jgi:hypothetical protein
MKSVFSECGDRRRDPDPEIRQYAQSRYVHLYMLVLDRVYRREGESSLRFVSVPARGTGELKRLVQRIAARIGRSLARSGLITCDIENAYLALAFDPLR